MLPIMKIQNGTKIQDGRRNVPVKPMRFKAKCVKQ
jgi:hypothetical protein